MFYKKNISPNIGRISYVYICLNTEVDKQNLTFHNILIYLANFVSITLMCSF